MSAVAAMLPKLAMGDRLSLDEFFRCWKASPGLERAELIRGMVYQVWPRIIGIRENDQYEIARREFDEVVGKLLGTYLVDTPGVRGTRNAPVIMNEDSSPQPARSLLMSPEWGGRIRVENNRLYGAPEFVVEVCASSASYDLHVKKDLYEEQHVDEYVAVLVFEREIRWHRWEDGAYRIVPPDKDGIWRSTAFPGLWLDGEALLKRKLAKVLETVQQGLESPEHAEFVKRLEQQRMGSGKA